MIPAKSGIDAPTPHRKTPIEKPATSTTVNVARGLVPRYGLPPAGNRSDEPSGLPTNTNDPHTSPILHQTRRRQQRISDKINLEEHMYDIIDVNQKHEIAKQIPAVQVEVRARRKKLVFAKQTPRDTRGQTGSRRRYLFLQNKIAAATERYTVASPSPAHGLVAGRYLIHSSYAPAQEISADFARYNFLGGSDGDCHNRRGSM